MVKRLPTMWETWIRSLDQEDPLEKELATHSSILTWKILWMELMVNNTFQIIYPFPLNYQVYWQKLFILFIYYPFIFSSVQSLSRVWLCDPMNRNTPGLPVHHQLPVHPNPCPLSLWCHPTISSSVISFSSRLQSFPASGSFQISQLFASGGQRIGVSASASVLPMNIQDWSPLGWTGWISLQSKGLSRVFNTTVQKHQFFGAQLPSHSTLTSIHDYWKNHGLD